MTDFCSLPIVFKFPMEFIISIGNTFFLFLFFCKVFYNHKLLDLSLLSLMSFICLFIHYLKGWATYTEKDKYPIHRVIPSNAYTCYGQSWAEDRIAIKVSHEHYRNPVSWAITTASPGLHLQEVSQKLELLIEPKHFDVKNRSPNYKIKYPILNNAI